MMLLTILLVVLAPSLAFAGDSDPSTGTLAGYAIVGISTITPLGAILLSMGRKAGQSDEVIKQHGVELARLQAQHEAAEELRRCDMAQMIAEVRLMRDAHTASMDRFSERVAAQMDRMLPRELAISQMGQLESNVRSVAIDRAVKDVVAPLVASLQPLIAAAARFQGSPSPQG